MKRIELVCLAMLLSSCLAMKAQEPQPATSAAVPAYPDRAQWWGSARFGLFIHWGPVSLKGTEIGWSRNPGPNGARGGSIPAEEYDALHEQFNPTNFNAKEWVAVAKAAGMKYLVFTSKHHDGFCEFDSKLTDYKISSPQSPFARDVVKELAEACHQAGLRFGLYYSQPDEHHPDYRTANHSRYLEYMHGQVRELLSNYGPIDILWFDGLDGTAKDWDAEQLFPMIRGIQPNILINNRCGLPGDFETPEQEIGKFQIDRPWESCITICEQWAWKPGDQMKSLQQCIETLVRCAGGDGNLLFNVGPMPDGRIEPRQVERLKEMGEWLARNGESIYGTRGGPWKPTRIWASTRKGNTVYLHVLHWNGDSIELPVLPRKIESVTVLNGAPVKTEELDNRLMVTVPPESRDTIDTVVKLKLDGSAMDLPVLNSPLKVKATADRWVAEGWSGKGFPGRQGGL
jgi:alpha-L-fucosidase